MHNRLAERVLLRYATAVLPSAPALGLLTKAAKGIKGGFYIEALEEALGALGWSVRRHPVVARLSGEQLSKILHGLGVPKEMLQRMNGGNSKNDPIDAYIDHSSDGPPLVHAISKHVTEVGPSGPSSVEIGKLYANGVGVVALDHDPSRFKVVVKNAWLGMEGWTITTPKGEVSFTNKLTYTGRSIPFNEAAPEKVWTFLYKSGLKEAAAQLLGTFGHETVQQILKPVDPRTLEGTGTCPCCFGNVKLLRDRVMRHGWQVGGQRQRGAYGLSYHVGHCFGVGYEPFELSSKGTEDYRDYSAKILVEQEKNLERLRGRPETITIEKDGAPHTIPRDTTEKHYDYTTSKYVSKYDHHLGRKIGDVEEHIRGLKAEIADLTERITHWKKRPLPGQLSSSQP